MSLNSALYTTLTGLATNQQRLDVVGNNIANVNTVGFKSSRLDFESLFSQTLANGAPPSDTSGGTNPVQIGLGTKSAGVTKNFNDGSRQITGVKTEMAIAGDGFFVLQNQQQVFSRDGSFKLNSDNVLVNANGARVQGYGIDDQFNIQQGSVGDITIPLGILTVAKGTTSAQVAGSFKLNGTIATTPSKFKGNQPIFQYDPTSLTGTPSATPPTAAGPTPTLLVNLADAANVPLFQVGDVISATGIVASHELGDNPRTLTVTATTNLQDYEQFMAGALGISPIDPSGNANTPGVTDVAADPPNAGNAIQLQITGNLGAQNDLTWVNVSVARTGAVPPPSFTFTKTADADGESSYAPVTVYDSLGSPVNLGVTAVLTSRDANGSKWEYFVQSTDSTAGTYGPNPGVGTTMAVGSGTLTFDNFGKMTGVTTTTVNIDRTGSGAAPTLSFTIDFSNVKLGDVTKIQVNQDGAPPGKLQDFSITGDGIIVGTFSNAEKRNLGQIALATFRNNQGLLDKGNNTFVGSPASGLAVIAAPGVFNSGTIVANALELSNVDLSAEFVNLISASTGFSASSRVISTSSQLLQELLNAAR